MPSAKPLGVDTDIYFVPKKLNPTSYALSRVRDQGASVRLRGLPARLPQVLPRSAPPPRLQKVPRVRRAGRGDGARARLPDANLVLSCLYGRRAQAENRTQECINYLPRPSACEDYASVWILPDSPLSRPRCASASGSAPLCSRPPRPRPGPRDRSSTRSS